MPAPYIWKRPNSVGEAEAAKGLGGIVAPVLAGFCLTSITVLVTSGDHKPPLTTMAIAALSLSAVAFLYSMQFSFLAVQRGSSPASYIEWSPEARIDPDRLNDLRGEQAKDRRLFDRFWNRAGFFYNLGLMAFLIGLGLIMVPAQWCVWNSLGIAFASVALVVEAVWFISARWAVPGLTKRLVPTRQDVNDEDAPIDPLPAAYRHLYGKPPTPRRRRGAPRGRVSS